jgi:hypothetical protein
LVSGGFGEPRGGINMDPRGPVVRDGGRGW